MKFGLRYCNTGRYVQPEKAVELLQAAEDAGFESAWTVEHTIVPAGYVSRYPYSEDGKMADGRVDFPIPDPLIWLAYVAAQTSTIKLGTAILILPQHNPVTVAKQIASLDVMSNARVLLGVGVGWLREEFEVLNSDFESRGARTDEYIRAMRHLWRDDAPTFDGEYVRFSEAYCRPQPVNGTVPVIIGGHAPAAARRAGRLGDGFFPARDLSEELVALMRQTAVDAGRDPEAIEITTGSPVDMDDLAGMASRGISRVVVPVTPMAGLASSIRGPEDLAGWKDVIDRFRDA
ncbi:MAG: LLM class F420-dependent oxidoreductase [Pseudomonadales bacterium]|jgi:probable F420-dependent oxidoreductase|nr:LLM class F420-dependent oxidoreductase [Pseudomonadales bacterium]MDP6472225.1 LLM class F420-dependent oxidoreductase [Pseudomonadales bacterium]MDP6826523.1 LLM class F420-dependent oxidoreductase [Pseudomonadales bacterium]MDP6970331.1 LLM class F420-dependent oxidoreductase [Pseudomonadales bacterium]